MKLIEQSIDFIASFFLASLDFESLELRFCKRFWVESLIWKMINLFEVQNILTAQ